MCLTANSVFDAMKNGGVTGGHERYKTAQSLV